MYKTLEPTVTLLLFVCLFYGSVPSEKFLNQPSTSRKNVVKNKNIGKTVATSIWMHDQISPPQTKNYKSCKVFDKISSKRNLQNEKPPNLNSNDPLQDTQIESPQLIVDLPQKKILKKSLKKNFRQILRSRKTILKFKDSSKFITTEKLPSENKYLTESNSYNYVSKNEGIADDTPSKNSVLTSVDTSSINKSDSVENSTIKLEKNLTHKSESVEDNNLHSDSPKEMPSFDEWKKQRLEEHEKIGASSTTSTNGQKVKSKSKAKKNYASTDCGAKILATNAESHHAGHVLNAFKDEYMLNPCNVKIWFVVELCESIQPHTLVLANFELFSSMPKSFMVYTSERYPSREWTLLGSFHGKDERVLQEFTLPGQVFGKYIKVELTSHYGSEHYCPLSLFQVFGTSMMEEIEGIETPESSHDEDDESSSDSSDGYINNQNLFGSAKDAVLQIVKTATKAFTGENEKQYAVNGSKDYEKKSEIFTHSTHRSDSFLEDVHISNVSRIIYELNKTFGIIDAHYSPQVLAINFLSQISKILNTCTSCKAKNSSAIFHRSFSEVSLACKYLKVVIGSYQFDLFCNLFKLLCSVNSFDRYSVKHYNERHNPIFNSFQKYLCSSTIKNHSDFCGKSLDSSSSKEKLKTIEKKRSEEKASDNSGDSVYSETTETQIKEDLSTNRLEISKTDEITITAKEIISSDKTENKKSNQDVQMSTSSITDGDENATNSFVIVTDDISSSLHEANSDKSLIEPSNVEKLPSDDSSTQGPHIASVTHDDLNVSKEFVNDQTKHEELDSSGNGNEESESHDLKLNHSIGNNDPAVKSTVDDSDVLNQDSNLEVVQSSSQNTAQPVVSSQSSNGNAGNIPSAQKESVFMRLSNRIKSLELNLSLSSQYLEELSQRYRKQMDEMIKMQKMYNNSVAILTKSSQNFIEKNIHFEKKIQNLTGEIQNLTKAYNILRKEKDNNFTIIVGWHLVMFVQIVLISAMFMCCMRFRNRIWVKQENSHESKTDNLLIPDKDVNVMTKKKKNKIKKHMRSKSTDLKSWSFNDISHKHQISKENVMPYNRIAEILPKPSTVLNRCGKPSHSSVKTESNGISDIRNEYLFNKDRFINYSKRKNGIHVNHFKDALKKD